MRMPPPVPSHSILRTWRRPWMPSRLRSSSTSTCPPRSLRFWVRLRQALVLNRFHALSKCIFLSTSNCFADVAVPVWSGGGDFLSWRRRAVPLACRCQGTCCRFCRNFREVWSVLSQFFPVLFLDACPPPPHTHTLLTVSPFVMGYCAGTAMGSLLEVAKFTPNEIGLFVVDPVTKEISRVRAADPPRLSWSVHGSMPSRDAD